MKLYTEEQLKEFFKEHYFFMERDLDNLTPIKLPSDEEIQKYITSFYYDAIYENLLEQGAKWVLNEIK
jgi:hypothetical protein